MDLHVLLTEGALLAQEAGEPPRLALGQAIEQVKRDHLDWEHVDTIEAEPDDVVALREDLLVAAVRLLELAGQITVSDRRAA